MGKEGQGRETRNKAQGQQTEGGPTKVRIWGQRRWLSQLQLAMASLGPTSKGSLPVPWAGVGMGVHPQPPYRDAPYSLSVALISFFFPIYRVRTALSKLQGHTEYGASMAPIIWPTEMQARGDQSHKSTSVSPTLPCRQVSLLASPTGIRGKCRDATGRMWWVLQAPWIAPAYLPHQGPDRGKWCGDDVEWS